MRSHPCLQVLQPRNGAVVCKQGNMLITTKNTGGTNMDIVVRGTHSIAEYKQERQTLQQTAETYSRQHWPELTPVRCWRGVDGAVWVEYSDGTTDACK